MSADIANWLLVNIVNNPQVFTSLIAIIILIVAIFLFLKKPTGKVPFRRGLGASLFVFSIFVFLYVNITELADVFIAWASIVLAGIAALSFEESRRLRKQYREREERDGKERLLKEIIDWAKDIPNSLFGRESSMFPRAEEKIAEKGYKGLSLQKVLNMDEVDLDILRLNNIGILVREGNFKEVVAKGIASDLASLIHVAIEQMNHRRQLIIERPKFMEESTPSVEKIREDVGKMDSLRKLIEDKSASLNGLSEKDQNHVKSGRNAGEINESANNIVTKAIEIQLSLLN